MRLVGRSPTKRARSSIGTLRRSHEDEGRHWCQRGREASRRGRGGCMMSGRLSGKVCVITGTGGSVGRAAALAFARDSSLRGRSSLPILPDLPITETIDEVIVYHSNGLHVGIHDRRTNETESATLKVLAERIGFDKIGRNLSHDVPPVKLWRSVN